MGEEANPLHENGNGASGVSRRDFLKGATVAAGVMSAETLADLTHSLAVEAQAAKPVAAKPAADTLPVTLVVNGKTHTLQVEPRDTLAEVLRNRLDLTGTKIVCDRGECGACTVIADGRTIYSCLTLAVDAQGKEITTVEGLMKGGQLHPVQQAFVEHDALMCGFCTPGFVVSVAALLQKNPNPSLADIKQGISGNICRCGTYPRVFEAAQTAAKRLKGGV